LTLQAVAIGVAIVLAGTISRNIVFAANLRYFTSFPWAVPVMTAYMFVFWRYLSGDGPPESTAAARRAGLRANRISGRVWAASLIAGGLGLIALVVALRLANRLVVLPPQALPDLADVPRTTVLALLLMGAPIAGIVEEAAFRGYMQRPIEQVHGIWLAILITGTMFALVHLDFTPILWPYYVAVAAIYGTVAYLADSILPAVVLHTSGNVYSNLDLWLHGQAEWQAPAGQQLTVLTTGPDRAFWTEGALLLVLIIAMALAYRTLAVVSGFSRTRGGCLKAGTKRSA
jgi:membrane protease YdiL (CAAX protease family)